MRIQYLQSRRNPLPYFPFPQPGWWFDLLSVGDSGWEHSQRKKAAPCQHVKHQSRIWEQEGRVLPLVLGGGQGSVFVWVMEHDGCFQGPAYGTFHGLQHLFEALHSSKLLKVSLQDWFADKLQWGVWYLRLGKILGVAQLGRASMSFILTILHEKGEAAEGKRKKYANCFSVDLCTDFLKIIADTLI